MKRYHIKGSCFDKPYFKQFKSIIEEQGFLKLTFDNVVVKYYNAELAFLLSQVELPMIEQGSNIELPTKTIEFTKAYVNGYIDGVNYFKKEFGVNSNVLYGPHAGEFIKNLHHNQYHKEHADLFFKGWESVKYQYPTIISSSIMQKFGYFAGILSEVEEMKNIHRTIFLKYDQCDVIESTSSMPKSISEFSISEFAMALHLKGIRISVKGVGTDDDINYVEKFGLKPGRALYNRWNDLSHERRDSLKLKTGAEAIIKKYKL